MFKPSGGVPTSQTTGVPGWETEAEERLLMELARQHVPTEGVIVELGGEYGRSASQFLAALPPDAHAHIYTVDLFPEQHPVVGKLLDAYLHNLSHVPAHTNTIHPIQGDTAAAGKTWRKKIDVLFVDAGHAYEEVQRDIAAWVKHIKPGGAVIFHDYAKNNSAHPLHWEVKRAVDEWHAQTQWERYDGVDSIVYFVKPKK